MWKVPYELSLRLIIAVMLMIPGSMLMAKSAKLEALDGEGKRSWIIELADPPVVRFDGNNAVTQSANAIKGTAPLKTDKRLDLFSPQALAYGEYLDERLQQFLSSATQVTGRTPKIRARYKNLLNGVALRLTEVQAKQVRGMPGVKNVMPNVIHHIETDAGPILLGADEIWNGEGSLPEGQGEGVVI